MVCLWWSLLNHKIHPVIGFKFSVNNLSKGLSKKNLSYDQLWKMLVLLMIILRVNNEYKEYLRTREYEYWDYSLVMKRIRSPFLNLSFFFYRSLKVYRNCGLVSGVNQVFLLWSLMRLKSLRFGLTPRTRYARLFWSGVGLDQCGPMVHFWALLILDLDQFLLRLRYQTGFGAGWHFALTEFRKKNFNKWLSQEILEHD